MPSQLGKDVRFLKIYALVTTIILAVFLLVGFAETKQRFAEIDVERINVVEKDGKLDLVISNAERMPPAIVGGKTFPSNGRRSPGMLFYNGKGDEDGGLGFGSRTQDGKYSASGQLMFDQYNNVSWRGLPFTAIMSAGKPTRIGPRRSAIPATS